VTAAIDALLVLGALTIVGFGALKAFRRNQRLSQIPAVAAAKGLRFSGVDPFGSTEVAFKLFREGDGRRIESVMWLDGDAPDEHAAPAHVFDYGFYRAYRDRYGRERQTWQWFTCAMAEPGGSFPQLRVTHSGVVGEVLDRLAGDPIHFESEEFNDTFRVTCDDRRFASALIDPQMMQFLLETKGAVDFETMGRFVLLTSHQVAPDEMPILLGLADEFVKRIPAAVWALYPKTVPANDPMPSVPQPGPDAVLARDRGDTDADPADAWDPTPGVDYDLDGHPVGPAAHEDPWHDHPLPGGGTAP
jgi:hypothetical protein